jgi:serine/threonine protein kinase
MNAPSDGEPVEGSAGSSENTATPQWSSDNPRTPSETVAAVEPAATAPTIECGLILRSRYVLEEVIGRGGTAIVFRARDLHRESAEDAAAGMVAVKMLRTEWRSDALAVERLRREFRQMQCLSHPGIVRVFDLDCDDDVWFMTMELVVGSTAKDWMQQPRERADALRVIGACCDALEHAHSLGFLHGDLKPSNVMLADDGAVKLIDFGSAPSPGARVAAAANCPLTGTPLYASPQILAGKVGEIRDDVFSLACLAYGMLSAGRHPFGRRPSLEDGRAKSAPNPVSSIPAGLFEVIERGLSAERRERAASAREFLRNLIEADGHPQGDARHAAGIMARANVELVRTAAPLPLLLGRGGGIRIHHSWRPAGMATLAIAIAGVAVLLRPEAIRETYSSVTSGAVASGSAVAQAVTTAVAAPEAEPASHDFGMISFEASTVHASAEQPLVAVSVKRLRGTRSSGAFVWRVEGGTAYPGVDYQRLQPQLVRFAEGQTVRTLFIPLINSRGTSSYRERSFTVELQPVAGGPTLGPVDRVTVTIDPPASASHLAVYQARTEP